MSHHGTPSSGGCPFISFQWSLHHTRANLSPINKYSSGLNHALFWEIIFNRNSSSFSLLPYNIQNQLLIYRSCFIPEDLRPTGRSCHMGIHKRVTMLQDLNIIFSCVFILYVWHATENDLIVPLGHST